MSVLYGFYDSDNHDRVYNAEEFGSLFDGLIHDGVYSSYRKALMVQAGSGMNVIVGAGRAWFNHTWTYVDSDLVVTLEPSEIMLDRIDAIILKIDKRVSGRKNSIEVITGTPSSEPEKPTVDPNPEIDVYQYPLAFITVRSEVTSITTIDIENTVGTEACPFVVGIIDHVTTNQLIAQWEAQWEAWINKEPKDFREWEADQKEEFEEWFDALQYTLDGDVAGHLQNEIDELKALWPITYVPYTLYAHLWSDDLRYSLEEDFPSSRYDVLDVLPPASMDRVTFEKLLAINLYGYNDANVLIGHDGEKPDIDIPVVLRVIKKGVISQ